MFIVILIIFCVVTYFLGLKTILKGLAYIAKAAWEGKQSPESKNKEDKS